MNDKEFIVKLLNLLFDTNIDFTINNKKFENCTIVEIDLKEDKLYLRHDYWENVQYLIKGRTGCVLKINKIKGLEIDTKSNVCNIFYEEIKE